MSYCRFSTDGFRCDVYAYEDTGGGWTIHVAGRKKDIPADLNPPDVMDQKWAEDMKDWSLAHQAWERAYHALPYVDILAPSAGKFFNEPTLEAFRDRMLALRAEGLRFPDAVLDDIGAEIKETRQ